LRLTFISCFPALSNTVLTPDADDDGEDARGRTLCLEDSSNRAFSPWPDESSSESETEFGGLPAVVDARLREAMRTTDAILSQLARIAVAIRRSGTRSRLHKADQSFRAKEHKVLEDHLRAVVLYRLGILLAEFDKSEPDKVQQRLIRCNLRRRHRFIYAQRHAGELERVRQAPKPTEMVARISQKAERHTLNPGDRASRRVENVPQADANLSAQPGASEKTGTTASAISESHALPKDPILSQTAPTQVSATATRIDYPRPPLEAQKGALSFQCPCCCQTFPAMIAKDSHWKYVHRETNLNSELTSEQKAYRRRYLSIYMHPGRMHQGGHVLYD
jgi:hypothetical protein